MSKKILIIDSHKSTTGDSQNNLHWLNARQLALALDADLIWSYPLVNIDIRSGYEIIIFIHASSYEFVEYEWLQANPDAKLFYITNEYNLGEPRILWKDVKEGKRRYEVIANHPAAASKVVKKYVDNWHIVNLNALCFNPYFSTQSISRIRDKIIYYGSFRKDRAVYFQKYFNSDAVMVSTHRKNVEKLSALGCFPTAIPRIDWHVGGLFPYAYSLYIEDVKTHTHYNFLANRFYESLNFGVVPLFDVSCSQTVEKSGYDIDSEYLIDGESELRAAMLNSPTLKQSWLEKAKQEKVDVIYRIADIVGVPVVLPNLDSLNVRNRTIEYEDAFG